MNLNYDRHCLLKLLDQSLIASSKDPVVNFSRRQRDSFTNEFKLVGFPYGFGGCACVRACVCDMGKYR